jgi:hypothetical protein
MPRKSLKVEEVEVQAEQVEEEIVVDPEEQAKIERKIERYYELDQEEKSAKKQKEPLNTDIKSFMKKTKSGELTVGEVQASFQIQERTSMNEEALVKKLKSLIRKDKSLKDLVVKKEVPNMKMVEDLIYNGSLDAQMLESCVEKKHVEVLSVKKLSKKKKQQKEEE